VTYRQGTKFYSSPAVSLLQSHLFPVSIPSYTSSFPHFHSPVYGGETYSWPRSRKDRIKV